MNEVFLNGRKHQTSSTGSKTCQKRLTKELKYTIQDNVSGITLTPVGDSLCHLLAGIERPTGTPYEDGIFWLEVHIPRDYPFCPPQINFLTRIYHPNVDYQGKTCLDTLAENWATALSLEITLISIISLLAEPGLEDPLVVEIAQTYINDRETYDANATAYTRRYAHEPAPSLKDLEHRS